MILYVFHTPELVPDPATTSQEPDCAVVIDVLRATTTIATALSAGAEAVQVFAELGELEAVSQNWPSAERLRAGERGGQTVAGFDLGNSPLDYTPARVAGKRIFMSTTNGTRSLQRVQNTPVVLTAALINVGAVVEFLLAQSFQQVWLIGSGWQGSFALEDTVCAGAIIHRVQVAGQDPQLANDEAVAALALYQQWQDNLLGLLQKASHGQRLLGLSSDYLEDLTYCSRLNLLDSLPRQKEPGVLML
ncbi:MAG: 2-phosphosulfolactate phosphatase family protein [Cyanobacteriota bacterium]|nr:2-phosphosulfolactate phosphatase family protein [Cyanobacteriota bacterium]